MRISARTPATASTRIAAPPRPTSLNGNVAHRNLRMARTSRPVIVSSPVFESNGFTKRPANRTPLPFHPGPGEGRDIGGGFSGPRAAYGGLLDSHGEPGSEYVSHRLKVSPSPGRAS